MLEDEELDVPSRNPDIEPDPQVKHQILHFLFLFPFLSSFFTHNLGLNSKGVPVGIRLIKLRKVFSGLGGKKVAVNDLSLNMFHGQITSLLGHNGAGW